MGCFTMYKLKIIFLISSISTIVACTTNSNLAPVDPIAKANNNDLSTMNDCKTIEEDIIKTQQTIERYEKSKQLNTSANLLSGFASILSLGTDKIDYVSNDDLNNTIKSYKNRKENLNLLRDKYCIKKI